MDEYKASLDQLTKQYNQAIQALESAFELEKGQVGRVNKLREQYSGRYTQLVYEYRQKRKVIIAEYKQSHPEWTRARKMWGWLFVIGILAAMTCCTMALPDSPEAEVTVDSALSGSGAESSEITYWNADNIPIPYLQDSTQYVSNPDRVLSQQTVDNMNVTLQRLNLDLGVQSVVIVVNHIENDDPFRLAQDVGNKYGVGYGDRGLMVVCGYQDHSPTPPEASCPWNVNARTITAGMAKKSASHRNDGAVTSHSAFRERSGLFIAALPPCSRRRDATRRRPRRST